MAAPYTTGLGCKSVVEGNFAGQIGLCGQAAGASSVPQIEGLLHSISIGADSTAVTVTAYDGTSATGTLLALILTVANGQCTNHVLDIQMQTGLYLTVAGITSSRVTVTFK